MHTNILTSSFFVWKGVNLFCDTVSYSKSESSRNVDKLPCRLAPYLVCAKTFYKFWQQILLICHAENLPDSRVVLQHLELWCKLSSSFLIRESIRKITVSSLRQVDGNTKVLRLFEIQLAELFRKNNKFEPTITTTQGTGFTAWCKPSIYLKQ